MLHRAVVITVTDQPSDAMADCGRAVEDELDALDATLVHRETVAAIETSVRNAVDTWIGRCDLMFVLGGIDSGPKDVTPEAVSALIEKPLPGFGELIRHKLTTADPMGLLCRAGAGIAKSSLVVWLPGERDRCLLTLGWILSVIKKTCEGLD